MKCQRKRTLHLHFQYDYWFFYGNGKKNYLQVYLEKCKYRMKRAKMIKFIEAGLESESELESDTE